MGRSRGRGLSLLVALVALVVLLAGCGGGDEGSAAHVNEDTGSTNGVPLDEREGTAPAPAGETDLAAAADKASCVLLPTLPDEGDEELPPDAPAPDYEAVLPTSGPHVEPPHQQADGAYLLTPESTDVVAALDHGRVAIQYAPDLSEETQLAIKGLYDTMYGGTLFFPNETMNYAVAATAWRGFIGCTTWQEDLTLDAIRAFAKSAWGKRGSEPVDAYPVSGPTPRDPAEPDAS
ncbi:MAG TPA: DUF3105 domain-containing protein [Solirubrobacterales bacterium]|nr:DUF3105 domain-containing protein [Solirubrobacterales bacterium]